MQTIYWGEEEVWSMYSYFLHILFPERWPSDEREFDTTVWFFHNGRICRSLYGIETCHDSKDPEADTEAGKYCRITENKL